LRKDGPAMKAPYVGLAVRIEWLQPPWGHAPDEPSSQTRSR